MHDACMYLHPCASGYTHVLRARPVPETRNRASPCPSAWTACGFGAQVFYSASAFNANVGAWNTASVSNMAYVRAAPGPAARTMADALGRASVRRGRLCAAAPPMRARVRTRAGTRVRGALGVGTAARRGGSVHASEYMYRHIL
jgi:surface protein